MVEDILVLFDFVIVIYFYFLHKGIFSSEMTMSTTFFSLFISKLSEYFKIRESHSVIFFFSYLFVFEKLFLAFARKQCMRI